jgi:hypothetical protein
MADIDLRPYLKCGFPCVDFSRNSRPFDGFVKKIIQTGRSVYKIGGRFI